MRYLSTFSGIGGMDLGLDRAGHTCVGQVEIDAKARGILARHWPEVPKHDDIRTAKEWADERGLVGRVDLVCGGAPCQDLSVAGRREGFDGDRSVLVLDMVALAAHVQAGWLLYENVPGLLSSNQGRDLGVLLTVLADYGFHHVEWRTVDAQHFGVPQRRRRVFLVAGARAPRRGPILLEREGREWRPSTGVQAGPDAAAGTGPGPGGRSPVNALDASGGGPDDNAAQAGHLISQPPPAATPEDSAPSQASTLSSAEAYQCHGSNVGPMGALRVGNGGVTGGVPIVAAEREARLASSSQMQEVASTVTTGTGTRYDPDTESLVVT